MFELALFPLIWEFNGKLYKKFVEWFIHLRPQDVCPNLALNRQQTQTGEISWIWYHNWNNFLSLIQIRRKKGIVDYSRF